MDKIHVSDNALRNSVTVLQQLADQSASITNSCAQQLTAQLFELDTTFKKDIERYIDDIHNLDQKLKMCVDENIAAVSDRIARLADYETRNYTKRNIG